MRSAKMPVKPDFPYYAGDPVGIGGRGWLLVVFSVVAAFFLLILLPFANPPLNFIPAIVFTGLPLVTLMAVSGWRRPALFRSLNFKTIGWGLLFGLCTIGVSVGVGVLLSSIEAMAPNKAVTGLATVSGLELVLFLARTFIQLIGEEVASILPLLAVLWLCVTKFGLSRRSGIIVALVVSTLWFSAMHLPTYDWNVVQCVGIIGTARVVLTLAYLFTRNMWVSSIAHIANDWTLFLFSYGVGHLPLGEGV